MGFGQGIGGNIAGIGKYAGLASGAVSFKIPDDMKTTIGRILAHGDDRAAFKAILLATVEHVSAKPHFNAQLEINDLWVKLTNLRDDIARADSAGPAQAVGGFGRGLGGMGSMGGFPAGTGRAVGGAVAGMGGAMRSLGPAIQGVLTKVLSHLEGSHGR